MKAGFERPRNAEHQPTGRQRMKENARRKPSDADNEHDV